jgi:hypothetical protein
MKKSIYNILAYTRDIPMLERETKRAWAEYFEMERMIVRQRLYLRLYHVLLLGFLFALVLDKIGF